MNEIESRYKEYVARRDKALQSKMKIEAALTERKKHLKEAIEECKRLGFNPDTLSEDLKKMKEVLLVKLSVCESDLSVAEEQMAPMLKDIEQ